MAAHECLLRLEREGVRTHYRHKLYKREERELAKIMKKETWFRP